MSRTRWNSIACHTLLVSLPLLAARTATAEPLPLEPPSAAPAVDPLILTLLPASLSGAAPADNWGTQFPVVRPADPDRPIRPLTPPEDEPLWQPVVRDREAILPDPVTGRELVDRVEVQAMQHEETVAVPALLSATPTRLFQRRRQGAPNVVLPVVSGKVTR